MRAFAHTTGSRWPALLWLHAGDVHLPNKIAMPEGAQSRYRCPKALLAGSVEVEARFECQAFERGADGLAPHLERSGRKPNGPYRPRAVGLNGPDDRAVFLDPAKPARALKAAEREHLPGHKALGCFGAH